MAGEELFQGGWEWLVNSVNGFLPNYVLPNIKTILLVALLIVLAYVVGRAGKFVTRRFLGVIGLRKMTSRSWAESFLKAAGYRGNFVELIADLIKWLIYLMFLALIIQTMGLPGLAGIFTQVAVFMPRFIVAIVIIVVGFIVADFFGKVFEEGGSRFFREEVLGKISGLLIRYTISLVIIVMALSLLGLDTNALLIVLGTLSVIIVMTLGLGLKDTIPNLVAGMHIRNVLKAGDKITHGEHHGVVERVEAMATTIKTKTGSLTIPNSLLTKTPFEKNK